MSARQQLGRQWRGGLRGELLLAVPPAITVLGALFFVEALTEQRVLFASLASSAFLIYHSPLHPMNSVRRMVTAHLMGVAAGVAAAFLFGPGYPASGAAMVVTAMLVVLLDVVHPPAISTALGFAFFAEQGRAAGVFLLALGMLAALVVLQRVAVWIARRIDTQAQQRRTAAPERGRQQARPSRRI